MKSVIYILFFCFATIYALHAQTCTIKCQEYNPSNKNNQKGVPFMLVLNNGKKPVTLSSNPNGILVVNKAEYARFKNEQILSFEFLNPADHEYYGTPYQLYNKKKRLSEICGLTLTVDRIW